MIGSRDFGERRAVGIRKMILEMLYRSSASHLGSNMSMVEILFSIYSSIDCKKIANGDDDRARIFVSKGHAAASVYATLCDFGILTEEELLEYCALGSRLTGHVNHYVRGVEHSTGALGHGVNVAVGCALGLYSKKVDAPVFAVLGDGEIQEGSVWEAFMFAAHRGLSNLVFLLDNNGISSITQTNNVIRMHPLHARFESFGLDVREVDGHSISQITQALEESFLVDRPSMIICNTIKGRGVFFAENDPIWHYKTLSKENYVEALAVLSADGAD